MASTRIKDAIRALFPSIETKSANVPFNAWGLEAFLTPNTVSGHVITPEVAMRVPAVLAAVSLLSSTLGTMPAKLHRKHDGQKAVANDHPAHALIHREANEWTSAGELRALLTQDALLHGNGYALANRANARVVEFLRLEPSSIQVRTDDYGAPLYVHTATGGQTIYNHAEVLHLRSRTSFDGLSGVAPIRLCREAIGLALTMEEHASRLFADGARPSAVLKLPATNGRPGEDAAKTQRNIIERARAGLAGLQNGGKLGVLFDGADLTPLAFSSVDAQFLELRRFAIDEIARAFRIPPTMLFELERGTWSNTEQMGQQFLQLTLLPWIEAWQDAYARVLLTREERASYGVEFIVEDLLRADTAARYEAYSRAIASRFMNPNEARALENLPSYAGGDEFLNPNTTAATVPAKEAA